MQRPETCDDQERGMSDGLLRMGIATGDVTKLRDEAISGTLPDRDSFLVLQNAIRLGQVKLLVVYDLSRLSRSGDTKGFLKNLVYSGGRGISVSEGVDTASPNWELLADVLDIHHSQTISNLSAKVRNGQMGRVLNDDGAGDQSYGFESFYHDDDWKEKLGKKGPRPKKGIRICEAEADRVRQIFVWFLAKWSIGAIARELTRLGVDKGRRATTKGWHPQQVHRIITNPKVIGEWTWGATKTLRNTAGSKKQVPAEAAAVAKRSRPLMRIVEQDVWDAAQLRMAELKDKFGLKPGQNRRGPKPPVNAGAEYPRTLLGGLLKCGACGGPCWYKKSGKRRYYRCAGVTNGVCK